METASTQSGANRLLTQSNILRFLVVVLDQIIKSNDPGSIMQESVTMHVL